MGDDAETLRDKENRIRLIDALTENPSQRSVRVWNNLKRDELTDWDLICFSVETLAMFVSSFPWLTQAVRYLGALVYSAHYQATEELGLIEKDKYIEIEKKNVPERDKDKS